MSHRRVRPVTGPGESVATTLRQLVRAIAGSLLLGLPPLFTMEMWFQGFLLHSWKIVALVAFTFVIVSTARSQASAPGAHLAGPDHRLRADHGNRRRDASRVAWM